MILPTFEADEEAELRVIWRGLLCDWELVKHATCEIGQIQRRTVSLRSSSQTPLLTTVRQGT